MVNLKKLKRIILMLIEFKCLWLLLKIGTNKNKEEQKIINLKINVLWLKLDYKVILLKKI